MLRKLGPGLLLDIAHLAMGSGVSQVILLLGTPAILRLHGAAAFGVYAITLAACGAIAALTTLRIDSIIPVLESRYRALRLVAAVLGIVSAVTAAEYVALASAFWLVGRWSSGIGLGDGSIIWWVPAIAFSQGCYVALRAWMMRSSAFKAASKGQLLRTLMFLALALSLAFVASPEKLRTGQCLLAAQFFADVTGSCFFIFSTRARSRRLLLAFPSWRAVQEFRANWRFIGASSSAYFMVIANQSLPIWTVGYAFGTQEAGWFGAAIRIVVAPTQFVIGTVGVAFTQNLRAKRANGIQVSGDVTKLVGILCLLLLPVFLALAWIAETGKLALLGGDWAGASDTLSTIIFIAFGSVVYSAVENLPFLFRLNRFIVVYQGIRLAALAAVSICGVLGLADYLSWIRLYAATEMLLYASNAAITLFNVRRIERIRD